MAIDVTALFKISYGLYVVTSNDGARHNGLIVNTVTQTTNAPNRVAVAINKSNYSHDVIKKSGILNVCCLTTEAPFSVFQNLGFRSGRDCDKFADTPFWISENGLAVPSQFVNSFMSLKVESYVDMDTHGMFVCTLTEASVINSIPSMTYTYYFDNVKPKPQPQKEKGYVCKICGYVYEGETFPPDFICPLCKHGAEDFEEIK